MDYQMSHNDQPNNQNLTIFQSIKQIITKCEEILVEESNEDSERRLWNFRELLTWKLPDHFCSNQSNKSLNRPRVAASDGLAFNNQINLYKLDFVTQRVKE